MKYVLFIFLSINTIASTITVPAGSNSGAIQQQINASSIGDTLQFSSGTFPISSVMTFLSGRDYQGSNSILNGSGTLVQLEYNNGHDVTINGLTFNGGGILSNGSTPANNIKITNNIFQNIILPGDYQADAIHSWSGFTNSLIQGNSFTNIYDANAVGGWSEVCGAIWLFDPASTTVDNNIFNKTCQPGHITLKKNSAGNLKVTNNKMHLSARYGFEIQGEFSANNVLVDGNLYDTPQPNINGQAGISVAIGGTGHQISNNQLFGPNLNKPNNQSDAIEAQGSGFLITGNYGYNWQSAQLIQYSDQTWQTKGNTWCGMNHPDPSKQIIYLNTGSQGQPPAVSQPNTVTTTCGTSPPIPPVVTNPTVSCQAVTVTLAVGQSFNISCTRTQ